MVNRASHAINTATCDEQVKCHDSQAISVMNKANVWMREKRPVMRKTEFALSKANPVMNEVKSVTNRVNGMMYKRSLCQMLVQINGQSDPSPEPQENFYECV